MYGMANSGKLFADELANWMIDESGFKHSKCQISVYYKYAPDGSNLVVLCCGDDCVYWYTSEEIGKCFVDKFGKMFHVKFLGYAHWFVSVGILQLRDHYISVDQARYDTSVVAKYIETDKIK